jgi:hypothetical protein
MYVRLCWVPSLDFPRDLDQKLVCALVIAFNIGSAARSRRRSSRVEIGSAGSDEWKHALQRLVARQRRRVPRT